MRVFAIHPDDAERSMLLAHSRRIGRQVESNCRATSMLPDKIDVVLFLVNRIIVSIADAIISAGDL